MLRRVLARKGAGHGRGTEVGPTSDSRAGTASAHLSGRRDFYEGERLKTAWLIQGHYVTVLEKNMRRASKVLDTSWKAFERMTSPRGYCGVGL